jgi:30S ribosomal protein S31
MGKGDKRTRKGKIYRGSHGRTRAAGKPKPSEAATAVAKKAVRKTARKK